MSPIDASGLEVRDLTLPDSGIDSLRALLGRHVRKTAEILFSLPSSSDGPGVRSALAGALSVLHSALDRSGRARRVRWVLHRVTVSAPIHAAARLLDQAGPGATSALYAARIRQILPPLLTELAGAGLLPARGLVCPYPVRALPWLGGGVVLILPEDIDGVRFARGRSAPEIELVGGRHDGARLSLDAGCFEGARSGIEIRRAYTPAGGAAVLATFDTNPLSDFEAHPDKEGNAVSLGGRSPREWVAPLVWSLDRVGEALPHLRSELDLLMQQWIPVGFEPERHLSASYQEAVGQAYLTLHPNDLTMMEAVVHEFQHNKLNALVNLEPLMHNAFHPLYRSPVRPDPRPLHGVLLAVHAFIPVAEVYRGLRAGGRAEMRRPEVRERLKAVVKGNHEGMEVLRAHADWTDLGERFFAQLDALDRLHGKEELGA